MFYFVNGIWGFPGDAPVTDLPANAGDMRRRFNPWVREIPLEQEMSTTPVFLPEKSHGQRSLAGYSPHSRKESDMMEKLSTHSTHTCITYSIYGVIVKLMCQLDWVEGHPDSW